MNHSVYVFGELGNGYTQYPDDYTKDFFKGLQKQTHAHTQLAIHRDGELMYYAYTRKLSESSSNDQYIGMCCVFNGVYTDKYKELFEVCEKAVTSLVVNGDLLEFTDKGDITSKVDKLYKAESHFKAFSEYLSLQIGIAFSAVQKLPPINYSISTSEVKKMSVDDKAADISSAIRDYSTVVIAKKDGYNTASLSSYAGKLKSLSDEIVSLNSKNDELKETNSKLLKEKKRTKLVTWLIIIMVAIGFGLYIMWLQNTDQQKVIAFLNNEVDSYEGWVARLQKDSVQLEKTSVALNNERKKSQSLQLDKENLASEKNELEKDLQKQKKLVDALREDKAQLEKQKSTLESTISSLRAQINSSSTSYSSYGSSSRSSKTVGASTSKTTGGYDKTYKLWLNSTQGVQITSLWVKADTRGSLTVGLYNQYGSRIAKETFKIKSAEKFVEIKPSSFKISSSGNYYLQIESDSSVKLAYHAAVINEFKGYSSGTLKVIGISSGSTGYSGMTTTHYQYFYNITYTEL